MSVTVTREFVFQGIETSDDEEALRKAATSYTPATGFPFLAMKVYADFLDEQGATALGFAYRWAGFRGIFPRPSPQLRRWSWVRTPKKQKAYTQPWELPAVVYDQIAGRTRGTFWYAGPHEAIFDLALALGVLSSTLEYPS